MKFIPILFRTAMVQAIQENRKTQTRRTKGLEAINKNPDEWVVKQVSDLFYFTNKFTRKTICIKTNYNSNDVLWVRETFYEPIFEGLNGKYYYKADMEKLGWNFKYKPSIFMPKEACRLFLKIKFIKAERLQGVSENDAIKEGVELLENNCYKNYFDKKEHQNYRYTSNPIISFQSLWQSINTKKSTWESNPWVWVIEFEKTEKPENFI